MDEAAAAAVNAALEMGILAPPPDEKKALELAAAVVVDVVVFGKVNGDTPAVVDVVASLAVVVVDVVEDSCCGSTLHSKGAVEKSGGPGEWVAAVNVDADADVDADVDAVVEVLLDDDD
eukprot:scaffold14734_cov43-Attheya_sp.AAC.2